MVKAKAKKVETHQLSVRVSLETIENLNRIVLKRSERCRRPLSYREVIEDLIGHEARVR